MRALILIAALLVPDPAAAQSTPPDAGCRIRSHGVNFGLYSALDPGPSTSLGRIELVCDPAAAGSVRVTLSAGRSARPLDRAMTRGDAALHYNLFADAAHNRVLGDGSNGTVEPVPQSRSPTRATYPVYGLIWPRQAVPAGEYADTVRIEVEF